jgi:PAS domain S-box-containing protein
VLVTVIRTLLRLRQSESRLLASEQRFRAIVNQATAGIVQTDLAGVILHANERYCDFVGRPVEELPGVSLFAVTHPEDVEQCRMLFNRLVTNGAPFDTDMRYLRQDGRIVWTSNSLSVVRDKNGVAQHAIAIVIDITERKRGEEREHFLAKISEGLAELTDQTSTLQKVTSAVVPAIADWCAVDLVDADGTHKRIASSNIDPLKEDLLHPLGDAQADTDSVPAKVFATRQPELIPNIWEAVPGARRGDDTRLRALREFGLRSYICVPLVSRDKVLGTLTLGTSSSGRRYQAERPYRGDRSRAPRGDRGGKRQPVLRDTPVRQAQGRVPRHPRARAAQSAGAAAQFTADHAHRGQRQGRRRRTRTA